jgi:hypothetical protein
MLVARWRGSEQTGTRAERLDEPLDQAALSRRPGGPARRSPGPRGQNGDELKVSLSGCEPSVV